MTIQRSKMEIKNVPFSKLLKLEVPALANMVIGIVEKHDPEELHIKEVFDLLMEEEPQIKKLMAHYGVHPLSLKLKPVREKLMLYVSALRLQLKVASKMSTEEIRESATLVSLAVDAHLGKLRLSRNEEVLHLKIKEFLEELGRNAELQTAISTLGVTDLIDNLKSTHKVVRELLIERTALISQRPKEKAAASTNVVIEALKNLFKQIDVAYLKHTDIDYKPLFDELNDTLNKYRKLINIRQAHNKRKADEKNGIVTDETIVEEDSKESDEPVEPEVFVASARGMMIDPEAMQESINGNGIDTDSEQSLDQKKAAASSTRPSQLSSPNEEA